RLLRRHRGANGSNDAAWLVAGNDRLGAALEAGGGIPRLEARAVDVQVAAAHAGGLDLQHHLARPGRGLGELAQLELAVTEKHHALHVTLLVLASACRLSPSWPAQSSQARLSRRRRASV